MIWLIVFPKMSWKENPIRLVKLKSFLLKRKKKKKYVKKTEGKLNCRERRKNRKWDSSAISRKT